MLRETAFTIGVTAAISDIVAVPGLERATSPIELAAAQGADLVLLPELMAVRYVFTDEMWTLPSPRTVRRSNG